MADANDAAQPRTSGLYHFVWRWHFYAGLIVAPFLIMLAVTGGLYLFEREIDAALHADVIRVAPVAAPLPVSAQEAAVLEAYPGAEIRRYQAPLGPDRASEWAVRTAEGDALAVFVDPADATVTGTVPDSVRLTSILSSLHGELMIGRAGDLLVELAASWGFILLVTGLFLWWPRPNRQAGVLAPRLHAKGRSLRRDLHAVPAMWIAPVVAFLILSGLPWSGFWGDNLAKLGAVEALAPALAPSPNFTAFPGAPPHHAPSDAPAASLLDHPNADELPWAVRHVAMPLDHDHAAHMAMAEPFGVDQMAAMARARGIEAPGLRIFYPRGEAGVFTASFVPDRAEDQRTLHVDPSNGAVLADIGWAQYSPLGKTVEFGVMVHLGRQFGLANQLLMAVVCAMFAGIIGLGIWMWLKRRPVGRLGAPPVPRDFRPAAAVLTVAIALGVAFPLAGATMALIAIGEAAWRRPAAPPDADAGNVAKMKGEIEPQAESARQA